MVVPPARLRPRRRPLSPRRPCRGHLPCVCGRSPRRAPRRRSQVGPCPWPRRPRRGKHQPSLRLRNSSILPAQVLPSAGAVPPDKVAQVPPWTRASSITSLRMVLESPRLRPLDALRRRANAPPPPGRRRNDPRQVCLRPLPSLPAWAVLQANDPRRANRRPRPPSQCQASGLPRASRRRPPQSQRRASGHRRALRRPRPLSQHQVWKDEDVRRRLPRRHRSRIQVAPRPDRHPRRLHTNSSSNKLASDRPPRHRHLQDMRPPGAPARAPRAHARRPEGLPLRWVRLFKAEDRRRRDYLQGKSLWP